MTTPRQNDGLGLSPQQPVVKGDGHRIIRDGQDNTMGVQVIVMCDFYCRRFFLPKPIFVSIEIQVRYRSLCPDKPIKCVAKGNPNSWSCRSQAPSGIKMKSFISNGFIRWIVGGWDIFNYFV